MKKRLIILAVALALGTACAGDPTMMDRADSAADDPWPSLTKAQEDAVFASIDQHVTTCAQAQQLFQAALAQRPVNDVEDATATAILMRYNKLCDKD